VAQVITLVCLPPTSEAERLITLDDRADELRLKKKERKKKH